MARIGGTGFLDGKLLSGKMQVRYLSSGADAFVGEFTFTKQ